MDFGICPGFGGIISVGLGPVLLFGEHLHGFGFSRDLWIRRSPICRAELAAQFPVPNLSIPVSQVENFSLCASRLIFSPFEFQGNSFPPLDSGLSRRSSAFPLIPSFHSPLRAKEKGITGPRSPSPSEFPAHLWPEKPGMAWNGPGNRKGSGKSIPGQEIPPPVGIMRIIIDND